MCKILFMSACALSMTRFTAALVMVISKCCFLLKYIMTKGNHRTEHTMVEIMSNVSIMVCLCRLSIQLLRTFYKHNTAVKQLQRAQTSYVHTQCSNYGN